MTHILQVCFTDLSRTVLSERAIEIGNALSAVKNTVAGDMSASSIEEIESVIKSHKSNRSSR